MGYFMNGMKKQQKKQEKNYIGFEQVMYSLFQCFHIFDCGPFEAGNFVNFREKEEL